MSGIFVLVSRITESDYELHNIFVILRNETPALFIRVDCHQRNRLFAGLRMTEKGYEHNSIQKSEKVKQKISPDRETFLKLQPILYSYDNKLYKKSKYFDTNYYEP
jgi:hypothetical protein